MSAPKRPIYGTADVAFYDEKAILRTAKDALVVKDLPSHFPTESSYVWSLDAKQYTATAHPMKPLEDQEGAKKRFLAQALRSHKLPLNTPGSASSVGSDPEIFVLDDQGVVLPAFDFLPDESAKSVFSSSSRLGVPFWDGFQCEFNIDPSYCHQIVTNSIRMGLQEVFNRAAAKNLKARLTSQSVVVVPQALLEKAQPRHVAFGCSPSLNVYGTPPILIDDPATFPLRFAGFHIHHEIPAAYKGDIPAMIKAIDKIAGVCSVALLQGVEDTRRREFYGRAGEYRTPSHGLEYRAFSSTALCHPVSCHLHLDLTRFAMRLVVAELFDSFWKCSDEEAQIVINGYDLALARRILTRNRHALHTILSAFYHPPVVRTVKSMLWYGIKEHLPVDDMLNSWWINQSAEDHIIQVSMLKPLPIKKKARIIAKQLVAQ